MLALIYYLTLIKSMSGWHHSNAVKWSALSTHYLCGDFSIVNPLATYSPMLPSHKSCLSGKLGIKAGSSRTYLSEARVRIIVLVWVKELGWSLGLRFKLKCTYTSRGVRAYPHYLRVKVRNKLVIHIYIPVLLHETTMTALLLPLLTDQRAMLIS